MVVQERFYTAADVWALSHHPDNRAKRYELSEGELIEMSPSGGKHGVIVSKLDRVLGTFVETHQLGYTTGAETGYILFQNPQGKDTLRAPDVGFIAAGRLTDGLLDGYLPFAPDLAVEVVSPGDSADMVQSKLRDYLHYGVRMVIVVYPKSKTVNVHTLGQTLILTVEDVLEGGDVLPGFRVAVKDLFPE